MLLFSFRFLFSLSLSSGKCLVLSNIFVEVIRFTCTLISLIYVQENGAPLPTTTKKETQPLNNIKHLIHFCFQVSFLCSSI